jgi:uncharacterized membrane-anchored protein
MALQWGWRVAISVFKFDHHGVAMLEFGGHRVGSSNPSRRTSAASTHSVDLTYVHQGDKLTEVAKMSFIAATIIAPAAVYLDFWAAIARCACVATPSSAISCFTDWLNDRPGFAFW